MQSLQEVTQYKRIYIEGHGCSASLADTEIIGGLLARGGYELVDSDSQADICVLVTCSVKSVTEQRMLSRIRDLNSMEGKQLIVAGCLSKAEPEKILKINPKLSLIGPGNLDDIVPAVKASLSGSQFISTDSKNLVKLGMPRTRKNNTIGVVEIASGCLSGCTFCQVKLVKGTVFSFPEGEIVSEVQKLVASGSAEIWLTSTDNSAYGRDAGSDLVRLLRRVCEIEGRYKVRVGMMNPLLTRRMRDELIEAFCNERVFKFLHLPVQSGSERILKEMRRGYSLDEYYTTAEGFRARIPDLTLSTDVIVGFPTESDYEFEESLEMLRRSKPDIVNISRFGARSGTRAALMDGQIDPKTAKERSVKMTALSKAISTSNNKRWLGWEGEILIDEVGKGAMIGRNFAYKPCVVKDESLVSKGGGALGKFIKTRVVDSTASTLSCVLV